MATKQAKPPKRQTRKPELQKPAEKVEEQLPPGAPPKPKVTCPMPDHFEYQWKGKQPGPRWLLVAVKKMTKAEARVAYPYRPNNKYSESRFGGGNLMDDTAMLLNSTAKRCSMCEAPTKTHYLLEDKCPDCSGWAQISGIDPRQ